MHRAHCRHLLLKIRSVTQNTQSVICFQHCIPCPFPLFDLSLTFSYFLSDPFCSTPGLKGCRQNFGCKKNNTICSMGTRRFLLASLSCRCWVKYFNMIWMFPSSCSAFLPELSDVKVHLAQLLWRHWTLALHRKNQCSPVMPTSPECG